jgi:hypothetical protein
MPDGGQRRVSLFKGRRTTYQDGLYRPSEANPLVLNPW